MLYCVCRLSPSAVHLTGSWFAGIAKPGIVTCIEAIAQRGDVVACRDVSLVSRIVFVYGGGPLALHRVQHESTVRAEIVEIWTEKMELVGKVNATAAVWEHFGFKPNDHGEPLNLCEPVCRICWKTMVTNTSNMQLHLKHNHPMQFSQLGKKNTTEGASSSSRQSKMGRSVHKRIINGTVQNGANSV